MRVWISHTTNRERYHTDKDCHYVKADYLERELSQLADHYEECEQCANGYQRSHEWEHECAFCGELTKNMRTHLPCEGVGAGQAD
jgi:hypothetical protein